MNRDLEKIREAERKSHEEIYSSAQLFEKGSWLQRPVKTVIEASEMFPESENIKILDLGCGIGRNSIPLAEKFAESSVDCVDILPLAIEKLFLNAEYHNVKKKINGYVMSIEDYDIKPDYYDFIIAVSAIEHVSDKNALLNKLEQIKRGLKNNGLVCLIVNSNVSERDSVTSDELVPQFEVNLPTEELKMILTQIFSSFDIIKETVVHQAYDIPREAIISHLETDVVTFVARK